jgi:hypothetical protein
MQSKTFSVTFNSFVLVRVTRKALLLHFYITSLMTFDCVWCLQIEKLKKIDNRFENSCMSSNFNFCDNWHLMCEWKGL